MVIEGMGINHAHIKPLSAAWPERGAIEMWEPEPRLLRKYESYEYPVRTAGDLLKLERPANRIRGQPVRRTPITRNGTGPSA
jgi:hypothetical protein